MKVNWGPAVLLAVTAMAALTPAAAHADAGRVKFSSPSGNVRCVIAQDEGSPAAANCQLENITYTVPPGQAHDDDGAPCPGDSGSGRDLRLVAGQSGFVRCSYAALDGGVGPWPALAYGNAQSLGPVTCDSSPAAVTCTDTGSGHFFRVSRDRYEVG